MCLESFVTLSEGLRTLGRTRPLQPDSRMRAARGCQGLRGAQLVVVEPDSESPGRCARPWHATRFGSVVTWSALNFGSIKYNCDVHTARYNAFPMSWPLGYQLYIGGLTKNSLRGL